MKNTLLVLVIDYDYIKEGGNSVTADFHSHILPSFDDGADDESVALKMIETSMKMGVSDIVSTSHCYPLSASDIDEFLEERDKAYERLRTAAETAGIELPRIHLGCEVHLTCDLMNFSNIKKLCIDGTDYMLLEMPSSMWRDSIIDNVYKLTINGIRPIIAHAERNIGQSDELLNNLYSLDVLVQINASSFGIPQLKKFIDKMFASELIHVVGTDMHNMRSRQPNMDRAEKYICKRYGSKCWEYLNNNAAVILSGNELSYHSFKAFKKKSIFAKN